MVTRSRDPSGRMRVQEGRILLVEGKDEVNLVGKLVEHCFGGPVPIQIIDVGSKVRFRENLSALAVAAQSGRTVESIGVIRDADADPRASFESVCDSLLAVGYEPPAAHCRFSDANPAIGVFIAPDGSERGAIEALCRRSVERKPAGECVETYLECLKTRGALESRNEDKTYTHAYLSAMEDPVARVGEGAQQGVWDLSSPAFEELARFIRDLHPEGST